MLDIPILTKEKFVAGFLMLTALFTAIWASNTWILKAIGVMLWQLYDVFFGIAP